jgi:hypothetical protein
MDVSEFQFKSFAGKLKRRFAVVADSSNPLYQGYLAFTQNEICELELPPAVNVPSHCSSKQYKQSSFSNDDVFCHQITQLSITSTTK